MWPPVVAALAIAGLSLAGRVWLTDPAVQQGQSTLTTVYTPPHSRAQAILNEHDGQHFAALAMDPTLSRPQVFGSAAEEAYRASRPLLGWLAWAGSAGRGGAVEWVLVVLSAVGTAVLVAGTGALARVLGRETTWLLAAVVLPGAVVQLGWAGLDDSLAAGLVIGGLACWLQDRRRLAIGLLCLAMLCRETNGLIVVAIAAGEVVAGHWRRAPALLAPLGTYVAWLAVVHARLGAWPGDAGERRLALPWSGLGAAVSSWGVLDVAVLLLGIVLAVLALIRRPPASIVWLVALSAGFALVMGDNVWMRWEDFSRVLLPMYAVAFAVALPRSTLTPGG